MMLLIKNQKTRRMHMAHINISISISSDYPRVNFFTVMTVKNVCCLGTCHPSREDMYCEMWAKAYTVL